MSPAVRWYRHRYHATGYLRVVFTIIPRLPKFVHPAVALVTAAVFFVLLKTERRAVMRNLEVVTGRSGWRTVAERLPGVLLVLRLHGVLLLRAAGDR